jgi:hypothetical protein
VALLCSAAAAPQKPAAQGRTLVKKVGLGTQKEPAGQGAHVATRTRLLPESVAITVEVPSGAHWTEEQVLRRESSPVAESA